MKLKNVKVGKLFQKKGTDHVLKVIKVDSGVRGSNVFAEDVSTGECGWLYCYDLKKYKEVSDPSPQYDIPEKAWLLREVVVSGSHLRTSGMSGYVAGVREGDRMVLVEHLGFSNGHDGNDNKLLCGWLPERGKTNYWYVPMIDLSFVNKDGSLTPMVSPMVEEKV